MFKFRNKKAKSLNNRFVLMWRHNEIGQLQNLLPPPPPATTTTTTTTSITTTSTTITTAAALTKETLPIMHNCEHSLKKFKYKLVSFDDLQVKEFLVSNKMTALLLKYLIRPALIWFLTCFDQSLNNALANRIDNNGKDGSNLVVFYFLLITVYSSVLWFMC